ncbi:MarR family winged helix-turn-helix transcriptional regulator [Microbulbifer halophilus]|uniref:MarR family winged helix-turn-helix transcriptional regulator n=1 Tax=Microbulbifer halophilus TaxID=453963 RepID=A0ABW5EK67_9GAMM|nr:MarR family transcriptional regulator [Microbulbifer halophilus]MCW8128622.1 MarR family transcriptional regulator [Microbulbifer halophilus]
MSKKNGLPCAGGDPLALNRQLCFALYAASRAMTRAYQPMLQELDITYPQYLVLLVLWESEQSGGAGAEIGVGALGKRLMLDSGTLTPLLKRMEARGLLIRRRDSGDERITLVALTDGARGLRPRARDWVESQLDDSAVSRETLEQLRSGLWKLLEGLERSG